MGAQSWLELPGAVDRDALLAKYRRAWVVASASRREGWGMTLTEAGACGTPSVASDIAGHRDAVLDGVSGLLAADGEGIAAGLYRLLLDEGLRTRMGHAARQRAEMLSWEACAATTLAALGDELLNRRGPEGR